MKIDQARYDEYWQRGWTVIEGVFSREEADQVAELAMKLSQERMKPESSHDTDHGPDGGQLAPRKINTPFWLHEGFRAFVLDQRLRDLIGDLLGDQPRLVTDQIFFKPPHFGTAKPYHQDDAYFVIHPADRVLTAWIALDDVDETNGCLRYIDGSHKSEILPHEVVPGEPHNMTPPQELIDLSRESLAVVKKGGVVFHHSKTLHTSHRNKSDRWRRGYATHWVAGEVTCDNDTLATAYFHQAGYEEAVAALA